MIIWEMINADLATVWLLLIGLFLLVYAVTDGADLGIGILALFTREGKRREAMMEAIGALWHAHQTWLVILGGMLFGAFPLFFSLVLSALYIPFILMLIGLIVRGVSFEFMEHSTRRTIWTYCFGAGSLIVTVAQGFALGGLLGGIEVAQHDFTGNPWDWATWYTAIATVGVVSGYLMLGSSFLISKTDGPLQESAFRSGPIFGGVTLAASLAIFVATGVLHQEMADKLLEPSLPLYGFLALTLIASACYFYSVRARCQTAPLIWNWLLIIFSFTALSIGLYPSMIPAIASQSLSVAEVAASPGTLRFMLVVIIIVLPVIIAYTTYNYWIFRGKTSGYGADS